MNRGFTRWVVVAAAALAPGCFKTNQANYTDLGGPHDFQPGLQVTVAGTGGGRVTASSDNPAYQSSFGAISCRRDGGTCWADTGDAGTTIVTLTASPDADSRFAAWSGDCTGLKSDREKSTVPMDAENSFSCTAEFDLLVGCHNPYVIASRFDTDADWERNEAGAGVTGSNPATGGNPDGFRLGGLDRLPGLDVSFAFDALHRETYDPAIHGAVSGFLYEEDRVLLTPPQPDEGIRGGFHIRNGTRQSSFPIEPPDVFFTGTRWTTVSRLVELQDVRVDVTLPFRVGYTREILVRTGSGTLEHGIDNVRISICR